jgi:hypothetical protein
MEIKIFGDTIIFKSNFDDCVEKFTDYLFTKKMMIFCKL